MQCVFVCFTSKVFTSKHTVCVDLYLLVAARGLSCNWPEHINSKTKSTQRGYMLTSVHTHTHTRTEEDLDK